MGSRNISDIINQQEFEPDVPWNSAKNNTWIIHPTRTYLSDEEMDKGFKGPINDFMQALNGQHAQFGDKLLVYGQYEYDGANNHGLIINRDVQIIGVGDDVQIT